jgi:hypothetical protein
MTALQGYHRHTGPQRITGGGVTVDNPVNIGFNKIGFYLKRSLIAGNGLVAATAIAVSIAKVVMDEYFF